MQIKRQELETEWDWRIRVFDSLSFPTLILKPNREILAANQVFLKKFNVTHDEIVGKTCHEITYNTSEPCPISRCPLADVVTDRKNHSIMRRLVSDTGDEIWEDRVFSPILDDDGEVKYIMDSVRDVTRLKALEKALRETKEFLEKVIHSSPSAIVSSDKTGKILLMNSAAEELFGLAMNNMDPDKTVEDLYPPGKAREIMKMMRDPQIGGKGKLSSTKILIRHSSGEDIPAEITGSIIYEGITEVATMGIFFDLREKIAVEEKLKATRAQLAQSEKMASLGQLAAGVAHEINNPLTGILFYANLALENLPEGDSIREDLEYVIEDVHRCKDIVKNLLAYSRQTSQTKAIIHINLLVEQSLALIRDQKLFSNIEINNLFSDEMMMIQVDKNQLSQVIINLVMNALDAMPDGGELIIKTYRDKPTQRVFLEISDTGTGIQEEHLSKIFDPFFTTKELGKGTGLGLSTVYGIVKENGGNISVKETNEKGTTFLVELPLFTANEKSETFESETNNWR